MQLRLVTSHFPTMLPMKPRLLLSRTIMLVPLPLLISDPIAVSEVGFQDWVMTQLYKEGKEDLGRSRSGGKAFHGQKRSIGMSEKEKILCLAHSFLPEKYRFKYTDFEINCKLESKLTFLLAFQAVSTGSGQVWKRGLEKHFQELCNLQDSHSSGEPRTEVLYSPEFHEQG